MKKIYVFLCILLLYIVPMAFAQLEIKNVKVYVNDERETGADEEGGDIDVYTGDILEMTIEVYNYENLTTQARYEAVIEHIDNGDDIEKTQDWFNVDADNDKSKLISFTIPSDARRDDYDLTLKVRYKYNNGTTGEHNIDYTVRVRDVAETKDEINLVDTFDNMSKLCSNIIGEIDGCFGYIDDYSTCTDELSTVKEERGKYASDSSNCNQNLDSCRSEKQTVENEKNTLKSQVDNMITKSEAEQEKQLAVKEAEGKKDQMIFGVLIVGGLLYFWQTKKKRGQSPSDVYYYEKK